MDEWLQPTRLIDCGHPKVVAAAATATEGAGDDVQKALLLYFFVRDAIKFGIPAKFDNLKASEVLSLGYGFCNPKATLFVALLRAARIPARIHMVSINMAVNAGYGMPDNVYGDHAYTEVFLDSQWVKLDSYVVDAPLFAAAQSKIKQLGWVQGYGVHSKGVNDWDGLSDSFCQYVGVRAAAEAPRGAQEAHRVAGELRHQGKAGVHRDMPQSDADFGVVQDLDDFTARVVGSPFALLRTVKFRVPFFFLSALVNRRIQAVRSGK
ncbi:hypothetical protein MNEG_2341 [Monoraphidium neglectum]|uniref:Transglutaminase-like domain-containing protein n=1 Tax=Monoraphidium neglectum TaxID=145388 RepID=A0A0D2LGH8_9CHLO|nr:hypothetical protein MNEG_2341 [Monoraphidium neglectum]KIZ05619.1 hypothetical protein MNEG_2341 [Monoraphidium neglectum]|eukprot:XP_013904638.1 hypothetical protein MNEG_2341 [Monoraphidium neglectum]